MYRASLPVGGSLPKIGLPRQCPKRPNWCFNVAGKSSLLRRCVLALHRNVYIHTLCSLILERFGEMSAVFDEMFTLELVQYEVVQYEVVKYAVVQYEVVEYVTLGDTTRAVHTVLQRGQWRLGSVHLPRFSTNLQVSSCGCSGAWC